MKLDGEITISRVSGSEEYVSIKIRDERARLDFLEVALTFEAFGNVMTGRAFIPCRLEVRGLEHVGKRQEHESRNVRVPAVPYHERKQAAAAMRDTEKEASGADDDRGCGSGRCGDYPCGRCPSCCRAVELCCVLSGSVSPALMELFRHRGWKIPERPGSPEGAAPGMWEASAAVREEARRLYNNRPT